ncbi:MAG TPA: tetratricopeptide repeat protein [Caldithrix abyssi]|uniref:Tetratricopeptide repeat protein n=1 Tax=Caldithrix abyssi TaxID=187145 RepID=A0A7V5VFF8_CALAY|nr:tetratricopeptide repeat protein [Caldithrix abyssi]
MDKIFCPSCGAQNSLEARFCSQCGNALPEIKEMKKAPAKNTQDTSGNSNSMFYLGLTLVLSLLVVFWVITENRQEYLDKLKKTTESKAAPAQGAPPPAVMQKVMAAKAALEKDPKNYELNVEMGNNYFDIGRFEQAIGYYTTAISVNDKNPSVLIDLGVAYYNIKDFDNALKYMNQALKISPDHVQGLYNLGIVYYNTGDKNKAVKAWEKLLKVSPDSREAQAARKFVEQIKSQS